MQKQSDLQRIAVNTYKEYKKRLRSNNNSVFAVNLVADLHQKIDETVTEAEQNGAQLDCQKGCYHCCTYRVEALAPEVFYLAKRLKTSMNADALSSLIEKLSAYADKASGLSSEEHFLPCPLLNNGACSVYQHRPSMCRKFNSPDAKICEEPYADIPEDETILKQSGAILHGTSKAYSDKKISAEAHELGQALLVTLTDASAEKKWFKGASVFATLPD